MAYDVFISYSSQDKAYADAARAVLERHGIRCWIDHKELLPGKNWAGSIVEAISCAYVMVLVISSRANDSSQVERELAFAVDRGIPVIPVRIEDVKPNKSLGFYLSGQHWLDAFVPPLEPHLERLAEVVSLLVPPKETTLSGSPPLQPPLDPTVAPSQQPQPLEQTATYPSQTATQPVQTPRPTVEQPLLTPSTPRATPPAVPPPAPPIRKQVVPGPSVPAVNAEEEKAKEAVARPRPAGPAKLLLGGAVAVVLIGIFVYMGLRPADFDLSQSRYDDPRLSACGDNQGCLKRKAQADKLLRVADWMAVRYDDPLLHDCMGYATCLHRAAHADQLRAVPDWRKVQYNEPLLADCMSYQPCAARAVHAKDLLAVKDWNQARKQFLTDCMGFVPCAQRPAAHKDAEDTSPGFNPYGK